MCGDVLVPNAYVLTGRLTNPRTIELDEALPVEQARVRVVVEILPPVELEQPYEQVMSEIRQRQKDRGYIARTREDVDATL